MCGVSVDVCGRGRGRVWVRGCVGYYVGEGKCEYAGVIMCRHAVLKAWRHASVCMRTSTHECAHVYKHVCTLYNCKYTREYGHWGHAHIGG